jgi:hypothetical protein
MENAYQEMNDLLNGSSDDDSSDSDAGSGDDSDDNDDNDTTVEQIRGIVAPARPAPRVDAEDNLLLEHVKMQFYNEVLMHETDIFTQPTQTTSTMEGYIDNVTFHERELIEELTPDDDIVIYRCNYGVLALPGFTMPVKIRTTNRGRKKKDKKKKTRKKQGSGQEFNSQITFIVRSGQKLFKFKVFRTGKIQLPGVKQSMIDDVIDSATKISNVLSFHLHTGVYDPQHICNLLSLRPVMKNYKFLVKIKPDYIIDMDKLLQLLRVEKARGAEALARGEALNRPNIFLLKYTRQDTKLAILFSTPTQKSAKKTTRVNIFMRGKVNILGALYTQSTRSICEFLHTVFAEHYDELAVLEGYNGLKRPLAKRPFNVDPLSDDEFDQFIETWKTYNPDIPNISMEDYHAAMDVVNGAYMELVESADAWLTASLDNPGHVA